MPELKPAYLIHGDDHGAIAERRAGLRALVESEPGGSAAVEALEGEAGTPAGVAGALAAMTLSVGWRVILVEGVERWRGGDVERDLAPALAAIPPETTVALFAREEQRAKAPSAVHDAVESVGGQIVAQMTVKPWELVGWTLAQAERLGVPLEKDAAKTLVARIGERQQRLLRELEKLALSVGERRDGGGERGFDEGGEEEGDGGTGDEADRDEADGGRTVSAVTGSPLTSEDVERLAAHSSQRRAFALADALLSGDRREATACYVRLREQGERVSGLIYVIAQRLREALAIALRLQDGESAAEVKRGLRMPARAAARLVADVQRADPQRLRRALGVLADLELDSRGGAELSASRSAVASLHEDTIALRAIAAMTE